MKWSNLIDLDNSMGKKLDQRGEMKNDSKWVSAYEESMKKCPFKRAKNNICNNCRHLKSEHLFKAYFQQQRIRK